MSRHLDKIPHRILLLGENQKVLQTFSSQLHQMEHQTHRVAPFSHCADSMRFFAPQMAIVFCKSNEEEAKEAVRYLRGLEEYIHIVVVCESQNLALRTEWFANEVDDVIDVKIRKPEFLARVQNQIRIRSMHDQILHVNNKLRELVDIDDLTGLYNMRSLYQKLDYELDRSRRFGRQLAVVMLDLDYFKGVNDGHDHLFGSYVLSEVGKVIRSCVRSVDIGARYGGDEFLIVLTEVAYDGASQFCERLRVLISNQNYRHGKSQIHVTASIGFSMTPVGYKDEIDGKELVRRADQGLYQAKDAGRNCVKFAEFSPDQFARTANKKAS